MGYAITWCAVREEAADALLNELGLSPTDRTEPLPTSLAATAALDTGWRVLWYGKYDCPFLRAQGLGSISQDRDVLLCRIEEHVMASSSELWSRGARTWWIAHEGENGPKGLDSGGDLPECFAPIRQEMEEAQRAEGGEDAGVDYLFEIPLKVAQTLVGFKHDEPNPHVKGGAFVVLSGAETKKGILGRLFGG